MLYHLFMWLHQTYDPPGFGVFKYITFRAGISAVTALVIAFWLGPKIIRMLKDRVPNIDKARTHEGEPVSMLEPGDPIGLIEVDHIVGNVELGKMNYWVNWFHRAMGFRQYRARHHGDLCRIEILFRLRRGLLDCVEGKLARGGF